MAASRSTGSPAPAGRRAIVSCAALATWRARHRHDARRERGRDGPALVSPILAFAQQQPVANDWAEDADAGGRARIIACVLDQDPMDRLRCVEQEALAAETGDGQHVLFVGTPRPDLKCIGARGDKEAIPARLFIRYREEGRREVR
jgi:hypothetical protein